MVPGVVHHLCGSRASSDSECGWRQCFFSPSSFFGLKLDCRASVRMKMCVHVSLPCTLVGLLLAPPANHRPFKGALGVAAYFPVPLAEK